MKHWRAQISTLNLSVPRCIVWHFAQSYVALISELPFLRKAHEVDEEQVEQTSVFLAQFQMMRKMMLWAMQADLERKQITI